MKKFLIQIDIEVEAKTAGKAQNYVDVILQEAHEQAQAVDNEHREAINTDHYIQQITKI